MSEVSKLSVARMADKDRETELCQTIIDACETLGQIAQDRHDGEYEVYWSHLSGMALDGPLMRMVPMAEKQSAGRRLRWWVYNIAFALMGRTKVWPKVGQLIWG